MKEIKSEPWDYETETLSDDDQRLFKDFIAPTDQLRAVIDHAAEMPTTLWFDETHVKDKMLECLIVAGQATTCFNLLRISRRFSSESYKWEELRKQLVNDWEKFRNNPSWLYNQYAITVGISPLNLKEIIDKKSA